MTQTLHKSPQGYKSRAVTRGRCTGPRHLLWLYTDCQYLSESVQGRRPEYLRRSCPLPIPSKYLCPIEPGRGWRASGTTQPAARPPDAKVFARLNVRGSLCVSFSAWFLGLRSACGKPYGGGGVPRLIQIPGDLASYPNRQQLQERNHRQRIFECSISRPAVC